MVVFTSSLQLDLYCLLALSFLILAQFESLPMKGYLIAELHVFHSIQVAIPGIKKRHHKWLMTRATFSIYTSYHWSLGPLSFIQVRSQDDFVGEKIDSVGIFFAKWEEIKGHWILPKKSPHKQSSNTCHKWQVLVYHNFFTASDKICKFSPIMTIFAGENVGEAQPNVHFTLVGGCFEGMPTMQPREKTHVIKHDVS